VPQYNFEWQLVYRFKEPIFIEKANGKMASGIVIDIARSSANATQLRFMVLLKKTDSRAVRARCGDRPRG
jgi:hypothetical protein